MSIRQNGSQSVASYLHRSWFRYKPSQMQKQVWSSSHVLYFVLFLADRMVSKMFAFNVIPYNATYRATGRGGVTINVYK